MLVFPGQQISPAQQVAFSRALGELAPTAWVEARLDDQPDIFVIGNTGRALVSFAPADGSDRLEWHADHMYRNDPARASLLYCRQTPPTGGDTHFACMYSAFEALSPEAQAKAEQLHALHSVDLLPGGLKPANDDGAPDAPRLVRCPLVRHHPRSGRRALWFGSKVTVGIEGWPPDRARAYLDRLEAHATRDEFRYRHAWRAGDAVLWDNRRVLHAGSPFDTAQHRREMHRTTIREDHPVR